MLQRAEVPEPTQEESWAPALASGQKAQQAGSPSSSHAGGPGHSVLSPELAAETTQRLRRWRPEPGRPVSRRDSGLGPAQWRLSTLGQRPCPAPEPVLLFAWPFTTCLPVHIET